MLSINYVEGSMVVFSNNYLKQSNKPNYEAEQFLWPVNVWQVYTSQPQGRRLNLFEKTILEVFHVSGKRSVTNEQVADWLGLETDMVSYIITAQLIPNGHLTAKGKLTEDGIRLLEDEVNDNLTTAYVFQCAMTGKWLPRICYSLHSIESVGTSNQLKFRLNRGDDYEEWPFVVKPISTFLDAPTIEDLNGITKEFKDDLYIAKNTRDIEFNIERVDKLTLAATEAIPSYLTVWGDVNSGFEWSIYDPFDISITSSWMAKLFNHGIKSYPPLGRFALHKLGGMDTTLSYEETCLKFAEAAKLKVLVSYSDASKIEGLSEALYPMLESYEKVKVNDVADNAINRPLITQCIIVIENICDYVLKNYSLQRPKRLPNPGTRNSKELLQGLIVNATNMNQTMVNEVLNVAPTRVYSAAMFRNSTARAQLAAIFISMESYPHHPLRFLLEDQTYLIELYEFTVLRDKCSHKNPPKVSNQQIKRAVSLVDTFLNKLFIGMK